MIFFLYLFSPPPLNSLLEFIVKPNLAPIITFSLFPLFLFLFLSLSPLLPLPQIPKPLLSHYCEFVSANPRSRPNPTVLLSSLREHGGYLSNPYISIALRLEELQVWQQLPTSSYCASQLTISDMTTH